MINEIHSAMQISSKEALNKLLTKLTKSSCFIKRNNWCDDEIAGLYAESATTKKIN